MATVDRWSGELACLLQGATGMTNEAFASWLGIAVRTVAYWHSRPDTIPGGANQELLHAALEQLSENTRERFMKAVADSRVGREAHRGSTAAVDVVADVADVVSRDPLLSDGFIPHDSIESLQDEVGLLARSTSTAAFDVFSAARRLREEARALADRSRRPTDLADLYAIIGQATEQ